MCVSTYNPVWNENFLVIVSTDNEGINKEQLITFEVMDWNRLEAHETVGFACIQYDDLISLLQENFGYERQISAPVTKAGVAVSGHDRKPSHLILKMKVVNAIADTVRNRTFHFGIFCSWMPPPLLLVAFLLQLQHSADMHPRALSHEQ